jgi:glycosyltransferase involved in cell wall biosynthesis
MTDDARRVVFVSQMFPPETGGNASRIHDTATNLDDEWAVTVLAPPPTLPPGEFDRSRRRATTERVDGATVHRLWTWQPTVEDPGMARRLPYYLLFGLHAMLWLLWNRRRYDAVVTSTPPISTGAPGLLAAALGTPLVVDVRDLWIDASISLGYLEADSAMARLSRRFQRLVLGAADRITVTTETLGEAVAERYGPELSAKTVLLPNGVDTDRFRPHDEPGTPRGGHDDGVAGAVGDGGRVPPPDRPTIVYTGNLGSAQALEPCVRAMAHVSSDAVLRLVGGGDVATDLRRLAEACGVEDRVRVDEPVPRDAVPAVLNDATLGVAPLEASETLSYAMPTKCYEYLACGLPTVVTGRGEIERFAERSGGAVHADTDPERLAAAFDALLAAPERREEMTRRGRKYVVANHDRRALAGRLGEQLSALVGEGTPRATAADDDPGSRPAP